MTELLDIPDSELISRIGHCRDAIKRHESERDSHMATFKRILNEQVSAATRGDDIPNDADLVSLKDRSWRLSLFHEAVRTEHSETLAKLTFELRLRTIMLTRNERMQSWQTVKLGTA